MRALKSFVDSSMHFDAKLTAKVAHLWGFYILQHALEGGDNAYLRYNPLLDSKCSFKQEPHSAYKKLSIFHLKVNAIRYSR